MTNHTVCLLFLGVVLGSVAPLSAGFGDVTEPGFAFHDTFPEEARKHVNAVLHRKDCKFLGGTSFLTGTTLRYEGQTVPLNLFLRDLARCPGITLSVIFNNPENAEYDWTVEQDGLQHDNLCVRINHKSSNIKIENLVMPDLKGPSLPKANAEIGRTGEQKKIVDQRVYSPKEIIARGEELMSSNPPQEVTVRFTVRSVMKVPTQYADGSKQQALHLVPDDYGDQVGNNFTAPIDRKFVEQLKRIGIEDISEHFAGRTITLRGNVVGTATQLYASPDFWTYHVEMNSLDNVRSVTSSEPESSDEESSTVASPNTDTPSR